MYIRRKVFSIVEDENGEERLFSTTEVEFQKEFSEDKKVENSIAIAGGTTAAAIGSHDIIKGIRKDKIKNLKKEYNNLYNHLSDPRSKEETDINWKWDSLGKEKSPKSKEEYLKQLKNRSEELSTKGKSSKQLKNILKGVSDSEKKIIERNTVLPKVSNLKRAGLIALGTGATVEGYKLYKKNKKKK